MQRTFGMSRERKSRFAKWFHEELSWKGKALVAAILAAYMVLGSGCLTYLTVSTIDDKIQDNKRKKVLVEKESKEQALMIETFHKELNDESYGLIRVYPQFGPAQNQGIRSKLNAKFIAAHQAMGRIGSWRLLEIRQRMSKGYLHTIMELETASEHGMFHETIDWIYEEGNSMIRDYTVIKQK